MDTTGAGTEPMNLAAAAAADEAAAMIYWKGAEQLRQFLVPMADVDNHPENPRRGDVDLIAESLGRFGQLKPIIVHTYAGQDRPYVVAGNHTLRGAKHDANDWSHIAVVTPEISDEEADKFLLMDNRTGDKATNDNVLLSAMLQKMMDAGQLEGTGYDADDVDDLLADIGAVAVTAEEEFQGDYAETPEETAARFTTPGEGVRMKEVMLMYPEAQYDEFKAIVAKLGTEWGIESVRNVVFEAVKRCLPKTATEPEDDGGTAGIA